MTYLPPMNGGRINATISGNTAGVGALMSTGTVTFAGGNNITLSQNGNALTISGAAGGGSNTFGMSNLGNTIGTSGVVSGSAVRFAFAGGNNITLSQSLNAASGTITISAASQTVQTQNLHNLTLGGNTAGVMAQVSSGTLTLAGGNNITLSQNGNAVTIAGAAGGGGGGVALANSQASYTSGTVNLVEGGGAITIATSAGGQSLKFSVPQLSSLSATGAVSISTNGSTISVGAPAFSAGISNIGNTAGVSGTASHQVVFAGGNNVTLSQSTAAGGNTITISAGNGGGGGDITLSRWQNMDRGTSAVLAFPYNTLFIQRLNQENDLFAGNITVSTALLNMSGSASTGASSTQTMAANTLSLSLGVYVPVASDNTVLTLINSASTTFGSNATMSAFPYNQGNRWLSIHSSQWSSDPAFTQGGDYVFGVLVRSSGASIARSFIGQSYMNSHQRSGYFGVSATTGHTSLPHGNYWNAMYATSTVALPGVISGNQVNRNNATAVFIPHVIFNNQYTY